MIMKLVLVGRLMMDECWVQPLWIQGRPRGDGIIILENLITDIKRDEKRIV